MRRWSIILAAMWPSFARNRNLTLSGTILTETFNEADNIDCRNLSLPEVQESAK